MIICKRPVHPGDHLQEAGPSGLSFARGQPLGMVNNNNNNNGSKLAKEVLADLKRYLAELNLGPPKDPMLT